MGIGKSIILKKTLVMAIEKNSEKTDVRVLITDASGIGYCKGHEYDVTAEEAKNLVSAKKAQVVSKKETADAKPSVETATEK
jgi:hypothetical protein